MHWQKLTGLMALGFGVIVICGPAVAAERAALADAAERRDQAGVRALLEERRDGR